ncbi:hypothetical protein PybrP1_010632 [[Pythium] brassicae (nom. inval.)]|nr:hypothetical protein PybrP1_010632 [[Pythium] brassicae (nom. inval.)]
MEAATSAAQTLRRAAKASTREHAKALDDAAELLVSVESLAATQLLVTDAIARLKQAAAVCVSPPSKAEFLGFALTQQLFRALEPRAVDCHQQTLLDVYDANPAALAGVFAALESSKSPLVAGRDSARPSNAAMALDVTLPLFLRILIGADETCQAKLALLHVLQRVAWQSESPQTAHSVTRTLLAALRLSPRRVDDVRSYTALVSVLVDLLAARDSAHETSNMVAEVCEQIVARVRFFVSHDVGVLQLLQSLVQLAELAPEALWSSRFLFSCAHALVASCDSAVEKQLLLEVLTPVLRFGHGRGDAAPARVVYTECLVLPLLSVVATHGDDASLLLQQVVELQAQRGYAPSPLQATEDRVLLDEDSVHSHAFLRLVDDVESEDAVAAPETKKPLGRSGANREELVPKFWSASTTKLLVSSLVFLASHRPAKEPAAATSPRFAGFLSRAFYVLATLAATTTDTMKVVLRFIKRMSSVASMQPTALRLLSVVWEQESRVYPRLEAMLYQDAPESSSTEYELVKVATIDALCRKDPELGVEYISQIQAFLEDERVSVAAMALNAIESLCKADCLDFYVVFKIVSLKIKKKKIRCLEAPLFLERLCVFYGLGTTELAANKRQATKLLAHLWELADSTTSTVRRCAYESLNCYSLLTLGLCVDETRSKATGNGSDDDEADEANDDEEEVTEDEVEDKLDELLECLKNEPVDDVRGEMEKLLSRVLEAESVKLHSGGGRGQANVSSTVADSRLQQRVSAVATREAKKKFPSSLEVVEMCGADKSGGDWDAILVAVEEQQPVEYSSVKRKDKLIKVATQNVVDMEATLSAAVTQQALPWKTAGVTCSEFLRVLSLLEGWQAFAFKYIKAVEELTLHACGTDGPENEQRVLIALEKLCGRLVRAIEEAKVFPKETHHFTVLMALGGIGAMEANSRALCERVFSREAVEEAQVPVLSGLRGEDEVVVWGALMGLARLSAGFASLRQLRWLTNLKTLLITAWRDEVRGGLVGVALAPVLLECVAYNLASSAALEHFLQTSLERLASSTGERDDGFRLLTVHFVLGRASPLGCALAVAGVANFFHHSLGIRSLGDGPTRRRAIGSLELECDPSDVESLAESVRLAAASGCGFARFALGAVATARELFFVAQKKRAFDAEVLALPTKGLVFKAMNALREEQERGRHKPLVRSLLACLTAAGAHLPPLDYEAPVRRLIKRFCDPDVTVRCIQFALTRGICDVYAVETLYSRTALVNADLRVQSALVAGLLQLAGRVGTDSLERLLATVSTVALEKWGAATCSTEALAVVATWIDVLGALVQERDSERRLSPEARDVARRTVTERVLPQLPAADATDRARSTLVRAFAREVLARIPRQDGADAFVLRSSSEAAQPPLAGPQAAMILAELVRSGAIFAPEKQTAVVVQWVLRQDFARWAATRADVRIRLLHELASCVQLSGPSGKQSSQADAVSWIHEVLDAFSRTLSTPPGTSDDNDNVARRHALFVFLACVCVRGLALSFEQSEDAASSVVHSLPVALVRDFGRVESVVERLWQLHALVVQRAERLKAEAVDYEGVLRAVILLTHIQSSGRRTKPSILRFWSVRGLQA